MPHVIKYLLVLAILMSGFYLAHKFRAPDDAELGLSSPTDAPADIPLPSPERAEATAAKTQLPVAALVDVDKTPALGSFEPENFGAERRTLKKRPTATNPPIASRNKAERQFESDRSDSEQVVDDDSRDETDGRSESHPLASSDRESVDSRPTDKPSYDDPLPDFAAEYQPWLDPLEEADEQVASGRSSIAGEDPWSQTALDSETEGDTLGPHRHEIKDGDTLELLAEKYLGDRRRHLEIYQANLDVLIHPRLLPIGVEISIPSRNDTAVAAASAAIQDNAEAADAGADPSAADDSKVLNKSRKRRRGADGSAAVESSPADDTRNQRSTGDANSDEDIDDSSWHSTN